MGFFDFYSDTFTDQQIDELHGIMAIHEKAGMRPYDAALQAVRDKLQQARENEAEVRRLVFEAVKGSGKFKGGQLIMQKGKTLDVSGMELHYVRHISYNSVGDIETETYSDDYGFGVTANSLPELKKKMSKHGQVNEAAIKIKTDNGETTVNALLSRIAKAKGSQKDALYLSAYGTDRKSLIETAILKLSPGVYTLNIEGRAAPSVTSIIEATYGMHAGLDVNERLISGMSVKYPHSISCTFTLGLQEIRIGKSHVTESALSDAIDAGAHQAATSPKNDLPEPTPAQQAAGNYALGSIYLYGLDIAIENPEGSTRKGVSPDGKAWTSRMYHHYGYIRKTEGADGDHVDVFLGSQPNSEKVFVIDQVNPDGKFDEHKVMLAFRTLADARKGYLKNYEEGWQGLGAITEMSVHEFKEWLKDGDTLKPVDGAILEAAFAIYESALAGEFIKAPNGSINFGEITPAIAKEIRRQAGFIRMRKGSIETRGEDHINRVARKAQIRNAGFKDAVDVVYAIASGYTAIYKGSAGRLLLVNANKKTVSAYIELTPALDGDYYDVETAFPIHGKYLKNKELLWGDAPDHQHHSLAPSAFSGQSNSLSDDSTLPLTPDAVKPVLEGAGGAYDYRTAIEQATTFEDIQAVFARVFPGQVRRVIQYKGETDPSTVILHRFQNDEDQVEAIVAKVNKGYSVVLGDMEAEMIARIAKIFGTEDEAVAYARQIVG